MLSETLSFSLNSTIFNSKAFNGNNLAEQDDKLNDSKISNKSSMFSTLKFNTNENPLNGNPQITDPNNPSAGQILYTLDLIDNTLLKGNVVNVGNGHGPFRVAYDSANNYIYVTNFYSGTISIIGTTSTTSQNVYSVSFVESGLPSDTTWSVVLSGMAYNGEFVNETLSSKSNTITFNVPNGSYSYTINLPQGYSGNNLKGNITVPEQSSVSINVKQVTNNNTVTNNTGKTTTNTANNTASNYLMIAIISIAIIIVIITVLIMTKRKKP
ncbi:hypothetical protein [Acidianus sp. RZ1]|uniref:hypothetical protein n=1 Tax=Acidianus sp. RZ1 TaxID=1540082 RepID=UPI0014917412|nr:hypothetical protein [Acidianus sp. RZ1]NON61279.1 hypothetical protein [Acidianus sp. RZ1]